MRKCDCVQNDTGIVKVKNLNDPENVFYTKQKF